MKQKVSNIALAMLMAMFASVSHAQIGGWDPNAEEKASETINDFIDHNENLEDYFAEAYGYVVFPSIGKGGIGVGAAHGRGVVYEQGDVIGQAKLTQLTIGFQFGGQAFSEVIFFENVEALDAFKNDKVKFSGQASAVAVDIGASADIAYQNGVAVYTKTKGGLMYEASVGGQKFKFFPSDNVAADEN